MALQIQLRRGTAAQWTAADPILAEGEIGLETDTGKIKFGNGVGLWSALSYFASGGVTDHGALTGLADDDHPQYLTAAEGAAAFADVTEPIAVAHQDDVTDAHTAAHILVDSTTLVGVGVTVQAVLEEIDDAVAAGAHPDLATHDALGLATDAELSTHAAAADPHAGYLKESVLSEANVTDLTDGGATTLHSHAGGGGAADVQVFTTANDGAGAWAKPSGKTWAEVICIGSGGGGRFSTIDGQQPGGGGGAMSVGRFPVSLLGATEDVTVGTGGASEADGAASSFGSHISANGGKTGTSDAAVGVGGIRDVSTNPNAYENWAGSSGGSPGVAITRSTTYATDVVRGATGGGGARSNGSAGNVGGTRYDLAGGTAGGAGGNNPGGAGNAPTDSYMPGTGGGGSAGTGAGSIGGVGVRGGGGGGGYTAGGAGGDGLVVVISY